MHDFGQLFCKNKDKLHSGNQLVIPPNSTKLTSLKPLSARNKERQLNELQGIMWKWSPSLFAGWQERFFTLKNKKLRWFKNNTSKVPQGVMNFDFFECKCVMAEGEKKEFNIHMEGTDRIFHLKTKTEDEAQYWLTNIQKHIERSEGLKKNKSCKGFDEPWKYDNISES